MKITKHIAFSTLLLATMLACSTVTNFVVPSAPTPSIVLFEDNEFTNSCSVESTNDVKRFVENGQLVIHVATPNYVGWTECTNVEYTDFIMEVDATQVSGPNNNMYGVVFRYGLEADEFYTFLISGDGFYVLAIDGANREEPELLVDWAESSVIKRGAQTNHIKVVAVGSNMKYYVNDQFLGEAVDARFSTGTVGFFAGSLDAGDVQVSFDNLKLSQP